MFKAIVGASTLQDALDSVSVLVDECKIRLNDEELSIRAVDPANVGMVDLTLEAAAFESYEADGGVIGVNLARLEDIAGMANSGDLIHLELNEETRKLHIEIDGLSYTSRSSTPTPSDRSRISPTSISPPRSSSRAPRLTAGSPPPTWSRTTSACASTRPTRHSSSKPRATPTTSTCGSLARGPHRAHRRSADSLFSLDYLKDMNKAIPSDAEVTIELGEEFPVKLHYGFAEGLGHVTFMLAPRIQSD